MQCLGVGVLLYMQEGIASEIGKKHLKVQKKKYKELLVRDKKIWKRVCVSGMLATLDKNEEWWFRTSGVNIRMLMLWESMYELQLFRCMGRFSNFKLYKIVEMHLNDEVQMFWQGNWMSESLAGELEGRRDVKRPLMKGCHFDHDNGKKKNLQN